MTDIFWGFFFVLINFNLTFNTMIVGLFPDFIGFFLIYRGIHQLQNFSNRFVKIQPGVTLMAVFTLITYIMDLSGFSAQNANISTPITIVLFIINLYIQYNIVYAILDMEKSLGRVINATALLSIWRIAAILNILSCASLLVPPVMVIFIIPAIIANIAFLMDLNQTKNLYEQRG